MNPDAWRLAVRAITKWNITRTVVDTCLPRRCTFLFSVSRLHCESESFKMDLILDVNTQIYPVDLGKVLDVWCISYFLWHKGMGVQ